MRNMLAALAFCASACAGMTTEMKQQLPVAGAPAPNAKVICRMERPTGTLIAQRICRREEDMDWDRDRTQETIQTMRVGGPCGECKPPTGP